MCFAAQWYRFSSIESGKKFSVAEEQISKQRTRSYAHRWPLQPPRPEKERGHVIAAWLLTRALSHMGAVSHPVVCLSFPPLNRFVTENGVNPYIRNTLLKHNIGERQVGCHLILLVHFSLRLNLNTCAYIFLFLPFWSYLF